MLTDKVLKRQLREAVKHFWETREAQRAKQGRRTGKDRGSRGAVTGGAQMDGFVDLVRTILTNSGMPDAEIFSKKNLTLPGYFRPMKDWDLLVVADGQLLATIEFKSQVGLFGNNFNNRVEEALGNATDLITAYREGAFNVSQRPWMGYLMLLEEADASTRAVKVFELSLIHI